VTVAELDLPRKGKRTILSARDVHQMTLALSKLLQRCGAETAMLVDDAGRLVARQGANPPTSEDTITSLVAGNFRTSEALGKLLGVEEFSSLIPRGGGGNLLLLRAGHATLLALTCGNQMPIALVRTYALETIRRLRPLLDRQDRDPETSTGTNGTNGKR
jgi:predicted regulator of Ras-like GTPase activity (Roadblock/LC7/MglB family)